MSIRRTVRRLAVVSAAAIALVPATAGVASAQSADDLCALRDQAPEEFAPLLDALAPVIDQACAEDGGDGEDDGDGDGEGDGPTGTPLDELLALLDPSQLEDLLGQLPTDELCGLRDQAPEEFAPLLDALAPVIDAICSPAAAEEPEEEPEAEEESEVEAQPISDPGPTAAAAPASNPGTLPHTGGGAALAGLAMLGGALGLRRFTGTS